MAKEEDTNSSGVVSVVFGILSILLTFQLPLGFVAGIILGILGIIFGIVQLKQGHKSWAIWGIVLSIIGLAANIFVFQFVTALLTQIIEKVQPYIQQAQQAQQLISQIPQNIPVQ